MPSFHPRARPRVQARTPIGIRPSSTTSTTAVSLTRSFVSPEWRRARPEGRRPAHASGTSVPRPTGQKRHSRTAQERGRGRRRATQERGIYDRGGALLRGEHHTEPPGGSASPWRIVTRTTKLRGHPLPPASWTAPSPPRSSWSARFLEQRIIAQSQALLRKERRPHEPLRRRKGLGVKSRLGATAARRVRRHRCAPFHSFT